MIHYEAICLGEIVGNNTWLMLDLANFKLTTLGSLVRNIVNNVKTSDVDVSVKTGNDKTYRIDFSNIVYNTQTNQVSYKDGIDANRHYKIKFLANGRFEFNKDELMILGKIANRFVIFNPGYSDKYLNLKLTDGVIEKMFLGFVNIRAQAGYIVILDEDFTIALNKVMKYKYLNARVSMPSDRKPYIRSYANGFPQLLKEVSDDRKRIGNLRNIALYMLKVAISASETSKIIDKTDAEGKAALQNKLLQLGKVLSDGQAIKNIQNENEIYNEIVRLFNSNDMNDSIFTLNSVENIFNKADETVRKREMLKKEQELKRIESTKPITDITKFSERYIEGTISGFRTSGFSTKHKVLKAERDSLRVYHLKEVKNRREFDVIVEITKTDIDETPFIVGVHSLMDNEAIADVNYQFEKELTTDQEVYYRGLVNIANMSKIMHDKIYWNK